MPSGPCGGAVQWALNHSMSCSLLLLPACGEYLLTDSKKKKKKSTFKVHQRISLGYLGEGQSLPETDKLRVCLLMVKNSLQFPQYFFHSSIISRWWDLTLSFIALIQLSERWIKTRLFAKKQVKLKHFMSLFIFTLLLKKYLGQLHQALTPACLV